MSSRASAFILLALITAPLRAQNSPASGEEAQVRSVVESYLQNLKFNDVESLRKAFWPDAKLYFVDKKGGLGQLSQTQWYAMFAGSAGKEEKGDLKIAALEVTRDIASVKVVENYPGSRYIDYLSLVRFDGAWKIVNKIYTSEKS